MTSGSTEMATLTWEKSTRKVMCLNVSWNESRLRYFFTLMDPQMFKKPVMNKKAKGMILPLIFIVLISTG